VVVSQCVSHLTESQEAVDNRWLDSTSVDNSNDIEW